MSDQGDISRLSRLTALLTFLQSKRLITATEIAEKFDISKRTAYRDIKSLEESGVPIVTEEGKGYMLLDGYNLPPLSFTQQEANALITGEQFIVRNKDQSLIDNYHEAILKVKAVMRGIQKDKSNMLSDRMFVMTNLKRETNSDTLSQLQIAITDMRLIRIEYEAIHKKETTIRTVEPQALYHTKENWILIAYCRLREDNREFRLDRMLSFQLTTDPFEDRGFDLMKYFKVS